MLNRKQNNYVQMISLFQVMVNKDEGHSIYDHNNRMINFPHVKCKTKDNAKSNYVWYSTNILRCDGIDHVLR